MFPINLGMDTPTAGRTSVLLSVALFLPTADLPLRFSGVQEAQHLGLILPRQSPAEHVAAHEPTIPFSFSLGRPAVKSVGRGWGGGGGGGDGA